LQLCIYIRFESESLFLDSAGGSGTFARAEHAVARYFVSQTIVPMQTSPALVDVGLLGYRRGAGK